MNEFIGVTQAKIPGQCPFGYDPTLDQTWRGGLQKTYLCGAVGPSYLTDVGSARALASALKCSGQNLH